MEIHEGTDEQQNESIMTLCEFQYWTSIGGIVSSVRDHRKKVGKQWRSPAPADMLLIPTLVFASISAGVGNLPSFPTFFSMIPNQT